MFSSDLFYFHQNLVSNIADLYYSVNSLKVWRPDHFIPLSNNGCEIVAIAVYGFVVNP